MNAILMMMLAADTAAQAPPEILLLDFTASYCQPCQQMLPVLQRMENDGYPIRRIDITEEPALSRRFHVERIPTLVLLVDGREVKRYQGLTAEQELRDDMRKAARQRAEASGEKPAKIAAAPEHPLQGNPDVDRSVTRSNQNPPPDTTAVGGTPLSDVFRGIFRPKEFDRPTLRAQSPDAEVAGNAALADPLAATIRVRVNGEKMQDVGTGTIVYSTAGKSIILTCAHLFPQQTKLQKIEVDVFRDGTSVVYPATILGGSHNSDLAVLQIQNAEPLPVAALCRQPESMKSGQAVFSVGCDNGRTPSLLHSKIVRVNPYQGPSNLTCEKDPVQGRSGGGLFDEQGRLLAVCSAADRAQKEGLYMSVPAIMTLLESLSLQYVLQPGKDDAGRQAYPGEGVSPELLTQTSPDSSLQPSLLSDTIPLNAAASTAENGEQRPPSHSAAPASAAATSAVPAFDTPAAAAGGDFGLSGTEITVLIESKDPAVGKRMIVIPQATPWLLELLTGEAAMPQDQGTQITSARRPVTNVR